MFRTFLHTTSLILLMLVAGCQSWLPSFYSISIRQGNYINQEMVAQLRPGMTKQHIQRTMGSPLVSDPFHQNRWDYYYSYQQDGKLKEQRHVSLFFQGDTLDRIDEEQMN